MSAILIIEDKTLVRSVVPDPVPEANEIVVAVHSVALNRMDLMQRAGNYPPLAETKNPPLGIVFNWNKIR